MRSGHGGESLHHQVDGHVPSEAEEKSTNEGNVRSLFLLSSLFGLNSREKGAGCAEGSNLHPDTGGQT